MIEITLSIHTSLDADAVCDIVEAALRQRDPNTSVEIDDFWEEEKNNAK